MANLAIKGHATRGEEVIEILEMLGGKNHYYYDGTFRELIYTIGSTSELDVFNINPPSVDDGYIVFTIEEFIEKYPYKVGDKVKTSLHFANCIGTVKRMRWEQNENVIIYDVEWSDANKSTLTYYAQGLRPYKEQETMDKANKAVFDVNAQCSDIMNFLINKETLEALKINISPMQMGGAQVIIPILKGYEFAGVDDDNQQVVFEKIGYHYPKNYNECCDVLELDDDERYINVNITNIETLENKKFEAFIRLIRCRDAYWKLASDWKPDWSDNNTKYIITVAENEIYTDVSYIFNYILVFPTEEMRDAFYENFKDLIEQCKELL